MYIYICMYVCIYIYIYPCTIIYIYNLYIHHIRSYKISTGEFSHPHPGPPGPRTALATRRRARSRGSLMALSSSAVAWGASSTGDGGGGGGLGKMVMFTGKSMGKWWKMVILWDFEWEDLWKNGGEMGIHEKICGKWCFVMLILW